MTEKKLKKDYSEYRVKVKNIDKNGNDISEDKIGPGGRRRSDGKLSALAYDFQPIDEDATNKKKESREEMEYELQRLAYEESLAKLEKKQKDEETFEMALVFANNLVVFLEEHPEVTEALIKTGKRAATYAKKKTKSVVNYIRAAIGIGAEKDLDMEVIHSDERSGKAVEKKSNNTHGKYELTKEERQRILIETITSYIKMKQGIEILSNSTSNGEDLPALTEEEMLRTIDEIYNENPMIMDKKTIERLNLVLEFNPDEDENRLIRERLKVTAPKK